MSASTASIPVKRACDSCHRRKVKCIGEPNNSCKNCVSAGLACTYNAIPQKKGPKGSRAKVLSELRETQRHTYFPTGFPSDLGFEANTLPNSFARTPGLLPLGLVESCIHFFFSTVYLSQPILHRQHAQDIVTNIEQSTEAYCMIAALCAYVMIQSNMTVPPNLLPRPEFIHMSNISVGHVLLEESVRVRKGFDYLDDPTHLSVITSWLYYGCYSALGRDNTAWSFLREATTQAQLMGLHDEETYKNDPLDMSRRRTLYWLLFVAERTHALHKHRPITLYPTIHLPSLEEGPSDRAIATGLSLLINMFRPVDDIFVGLWNKVHTQANPGRIAQLQARLSEVLPGYLECTEPQAVELRVTQQWLRMMVWQLCVSQGLVSSVAADPAMTFKYPLEISRDMLAMMQQFPQQAIEVHGVGLIEKLFDIACCLIDVVACIPFSPNSLALGPREHVSHFLTLFSALRGGQTRYLQLLLAKVSDVLPSFPLPRSLDVSQGVHASTIGTPPGGYEPHPSSTAEDYTSQPVVTSMSYPSTELIRQLAAQTGAQLPFNTAPQSLLQATSSRVEDLSLYESPHSNRQSSGSAPPRHSVTPAPYEPPPIHSSHATPTHVPSSMQQIPSSLPAHHGHVQGHPILNPGAYEPGYAVQGYRMDPSMMFKQEDAKSAHIQGVMYSHSTQGPGGRGSFGQGRGSSGSYAG
ncbi:hypothetical protein BDV95DRAFT_631340 [Massariosphaeria phaeospora]|uniref:Zn(2)-C6 fungal-type domain-containing protein n=1 Tax=Massariosphaeria phaeospora TaxID=100035 RepID=A0A7C8M3L8_9PLEO|nr:hypothetical protein BDV95DRAFT_631340 [Massariosphaeria phaeospora]